MKRQFFTLLAGLLCLSGSVAQAAKVDTLSVRSNAMNKNVTVLTVRPDKAVGGEKCPVIYLLHGHGGNAFTWMTIKPDLPQIADREGIIFVCPDGKTVGIGIVLVIRIIGMRVLLPKNWWNI